MAGDQEDDGLVADVAVVEFLAGLLVDAVEHVVEQVVLLGVAAAVLPPLLDHVLDQAVHVFDVGAVLLVLLLVDQLLERQPAGVHRGLERADHGVDERVVAVAVERVEPVIEAAQPDGVEREPRHVVGDVDLVVRVEPLPFEHQLVGDIEHGGVVALHRALREGRQQDVVRFRPVGLLGVGGEQAVRERAQPAQEAARALVEARLVADLVDQREARHHDHWPAHHVEPVDRA